VGGQVGDHQLAQRAEAWDDRVMVHHERPVGGQAHVELDAVGAQPPGLGEGLERVLDKTLCATPVSPHGRQRRPPTARSRKIGALFGKFTKTPCQARRRPLLFSR
jgi:hypothetical protein